MNYDDTSYIANYSPFKLQKLALTEVSYTMLLHPAMGHCL